MSSTTTTKIRRDKHFLWRKEVKEIQLGDNADKHKIRKDIVINHVKKNKNECHKMKID